ncbi:hypothetical protein NDI56_00085 [Haloarcula sp. S1CR25-12]|uniref:DUF8081 domain-containing protein n=1 Tax=Haloarcula saliterrae TaxID=2950534 RepID=A0ABU2F6A5_9EURY|nr:hypothetical protein [Haloarcula sp. S1CR25-12]MDS0257798.1 hypothetical protein [Haloarcula sp. S1CR25-12]
MTDSGYLVAVKPSARRVSARVGRWVNREGTTRAFDSKPLAREWARACCSASATVWVQDAPAWADDGADGYLVGRRWRDAAAERPGQQATVTDIDG